MKLIYEGRRGRRVLMIYQVRLGHYYWTVRHSNGEKECGGQTETVRAALLAAMWPGDRAGGK